MTRLERVSAHGWKYPKAYQEGGRYMKTKKSIMKIGIYLCILLLLLLPILSSPVAASVWFKIKAYTGNIPGGVAVGLMAGSKPPGWHWETDDGSGILYIYCECYMYDTNGGGTGSEHYIELVAVELPYGTGPEYYDYLEATLNPNSQITPYPTTIFVNVPYTPGGGTQTFEVFVYAQCRDIATEVMVDNLWYWWIVV